VKWKRGDRAVHYIAPGSKLQKRWGTIMGPEIDGLIDFLPDNNGWTKPYRIPKQHVRRLVRRKKAG
jgi:hypothetical protein